MQVTELSPLLQLKDLVISYKNQDHEVNVVKGIDLTIMPNEIVALVGESGSGKSLTAQSILRLFYSKNISITSGSIYYKSEDVLKKKESEMANFRGEAIGFIPQNPLSSLNPTLTIGFQMSESLLVKRRITKNEAKEEAIKMLYQMGIGDPERRYSSYPHELSGGMRQRVLIGMALINNPPLLIADEPTTALDMTIQAQILDLFQKIQKERGTSFLFITHDMGIVARLADKVAVMKDGMIVETGVTSEIFKKPKHPYTNTLLRSLHNPKFEQNKSVGAYS